MIWGYPTILCPRTFLMTLYDSSNCYLSLLLSRPKQLKRFWLNKVRLLI